MLKELDGEYTDWRQAFGYAGEPDTDAGGGHAPSTFPGSKTSCAPFTRNDVAELYGMRAGENDGPSWMCWGRLHDGRYFYLEAGCDYTGWD